MIHAKKDLENIQKQFISVDELLELFSACENTTLEESANWLINNIQILNRTKKLVLMDRYTLIEYEYNDNDFYNCPIKTLELVSSGEDCGLYSDSVGFARYLVLMDLKERGLDIHDDLIKNSYPYVSKTCRDDDNFYKNQFIYLERKLFSSAELRQAKPQKDDINFIHFLDENDPRYVPVFALLLRVHHDLNFIGRFLEQKATGEKPTKQERVADCIDEYGAKYNVLNTITEVVPLV